MELFLSLYMIVFYTPALQQYSEMCIRIPEIQNNLHDMKCIFIRLFRNFVNFEIFYILFYHSVSVLPSERIHLHFRLQFITTKVLLVIPDTSRLMRFVNSFTLHLAASMKSSRLEYPTAIFLFLY